MIRERTASFAPTLVRRSSLFMLFLICGIAPAHSYHSVSLAGTFNNWNTSDPERQLKKTGKNSWELTKIFYKGKHEFKFVMDGSWNAHRGVKEGWSVEQPGRNIPLLLEKTGFYKISLDLNAERWSLEEVKGKKAIADVALEPFYPAEKIMTLDASLSQPREGRKIRSYSWAQSKKDEIRLLGLPFTSSDPTLIVSPRYAGTYHLKLSVNDGKKGITHSFQLTVKETVQLIGSLVGGMKTMEPLESGKHRFLTKVKGGNRYTLRILKAG